jgi:ATPase subunit of ABC transporter with duplicated ATPase domains
MPPGVAVVDAFKNLIRHGKNHVHIRQDDTSSSAAPPADTHANYQRAQPERRQQANAQPQTQQKQQQQQSAKVQPVATKQSQQYTRESEKIVQEERAAKEKMPTYKGLERFKLIQKMGECASRCLDIPCHFTDHLPLQWSILQRIQGPGSHIGN